MYVNSPITFIDEIFTSFAIREYNHVSTEILTATIQEITGMMNPKSIKNFIKTIESFYIIRLTLHGDWDINYERLNQKFPSNTHYKKMLGLPKEEETDKYNELFDNE